MPPPIKSSRVPKPGAPEKGGDAAAEKQMRVNLTIPQGQYPVLFFANKIGVETISNETLIHFGTISESMGALAQFATIFDRDMISANKENWADFQAKGAPLSSSNADFSFRCSPVALKSVPLTSWASWARTNDQAEVRLFALSMCETVDARRENKGSLTAQPIALVRMSADLQGHLLAHLLLKAHGHD